MLVRVLAIMYSRYIRPYDVAGTIITILLTVIPLFIGFYVFHLSYYYPYYNYEFIQLFVLNVFSYMSRSAIKDFIVTMLFYLIPGFAFNIPFILEIFLKRNIIEAHENKKSMHIQKNIPIPFLNYISLIFISFIIIMTSVINENRFSFDIFSSSNNDTTGKYDASINELMSIDEAAYNKAYEIINQEKYENFFPNEYYFHSNDGVITIYADNNYKGDEYYVYYECQNNHMSVECEWGEWYGLVDYSNFIDLSFKADGEGYAVIVITNSDNDEKIRIFIDTYERNYQNNIGENLLYSNLTFPLSY